MEIIVGKTSGFCYGVKNAVEKAESEVEKSNKKIYCLGELVHNKTVIENLQKKGLIFIENIEEANEKTIIRAHGIKKEIYEEAKNRKIQLIDLTCPNVLKIHDTVEKYSNKNYYIFLIGKKEHPETIGTYSFCGKNATIISTVEEVDNAIKSFQKTNLEKLLIISQTTYSLKVFEEIVSKVKEIIPEKIKVEVKNTICLSTSQRQKETKEISQKVDLMIIVGGKNSSNTQKLYDISCENCKKVLFVETKNDIDFNELKEINKIGIMAGASTPNTIVEEIVQKLKQKNP